MVFVCDCKLDEEKVKEIFSFVQDAVRYPKIGSGLTPGNALNIQKITGEVEFSILMKIYFYVSRAEFEKLRDLVHVNMRSYREDENSIFIELDNEKYIEYNAKIGYGIRIIYDPREHTLIVDELVKMKPASSEAKKEETTGARIFSVVAGSLKNVLLRLRPYKSYTEEEEEGEEEEDEY